MITNLEQWRKHQSTLKESFFGVPEAQPHEVENEEVKKNALIEFGKYVRDRGNDKIDFVGFGHRDVNVGPMAQLKIRTGILGKHYAVFVEDSIHNLSVIPIGDSYKSDKKVTGTKEEIYDWCLSKLEK